MCRRRGVLVWPVLFAGCYRAAPLDETAILSNLGVLQALGGLSPASRGTRLTEQSAVEIALESNPTLAVAREGLAIAQGDRTRAAAWRNPEVRVTNLGYEEGNDRLDRVVFALRVFPPHPVEMAARKDEADAGIERARFRVEEVQASLRRDARLAFRRVWFASQRVRLAERLVETRRRALDLERTAVSGGIGDPRAVAAAEAALAEAEGAQRRAMDERRFAIGDLAAVLGLASTEGLEPDAPADLMACPAPPRDLRSFEEQAVQKNPAVKQERAAYAQAEAVLRREYGRRIPWFSFVQAGYDFDPYGKRSGVHGGVGLDLPVWDWNTGGIARAEASRRQQAAQFRETLRQVLGSVRVAYEGWVTWFERLDRLRTETWPVVSQAEREAAAAVEQARLAESELLRARERQIRVEGEILDATLACTEAWLSLEAAVGN